MVNAFIEDLVSAHHVIEGVNELGDRDYKPLSCHKLVEASLNNRVHGRDTVQIYNTKIVSHWLLKRSLGREPQRLAAVAAEGSDESQPRFFIFLKA
jgi:hypothetical protein